MESKESEIKEIYRSVYAYAKHLEDQKKTLTCIGDLFNSDREDKRISLVQRCIALIFKDFDTIGKKSREILWRKGYYDHIAFTKKIASNSKDKLKPEHTEKLKKLLLEGITNYKRIATKMEEMYDLDLKLWIDFSIIDDQDHGKFHPISNGHSVEKNLGVVGCALETIHSAFLSLGDLHRYYIDFKLDPILKSSSNHQEITKDLAAQFYFEAFKINPIVGMTQNQLGTLFYGQNYDLDSIYHYLYSLICTVPFELSETNVCKLFAAHSNYLEKLDADKMEFCLKDFYARLFLIIDIYFFDKDVPDFTSLCHCVLIDLKKVLCSKKFQISSDSIFKIVCILYFCLSKLKMINSQKIYALNAFLVAVCSDLMDSCIFNIEQEILAKAEQNDKFHADYDQRYNKYETYVKQSREDYREWYENGGRAVVGGGAGHDAGQNRAKRATNSFKCMPAASCSQDRKYSPPVERTRQQAIDKTKKDMAAAAAAAAATTKSSDETKDSDLKTPLSNKSKKKGVKLRRRRKKIAESDDASSCYDSESDLNSDFSSEEDDCFDSELSSNFESDFSEIEAEVEMPTKKPEIDVKAEASTSKPITTKFQLYDDDDEEDDDLQNTDDIVVVDRADLNIPDALSQDISDDFNMLTLNNPLDFKFELADDGNGRGLNGGIKIAPPQPAKFAENPPLKLKYKNKYNKVDPNIIIEFTKTEPTMCALKVIFDWLRINHEILLGCYHSNPEFIHKIMKLLNFLNIDIFTQKVFFEQDLVKTKSESSARQNIFEIFDNRPLFPLREDLNLKSFDLFRTVQIPLDWESTIRDKITTDEENVMRILKMVDFGFYICKSKKFNYQFCMRTRKFTENNKKKRENKKPGRRRERRRRNSRGGGCAGGQRRNEGRTRRYSDRKSGQQRKLKDYNTSNEEKDTGVEEFKMPEQKCLKKGYLRSKQPEKFSSSGADEEKSENQKDEMDKKCEIMGKLWLKNEVEVLEEKIRKFPKDIVLTPFVVIDSKALVEYTTIVKELVKCRKFIVLIPNSVLGELDDLKKRSEAARNVIRWLEKEFKYGNRYLRSQRDNENLTLSLIKVPRKLNREASIFLKIAQFCNYMVTNHFNGDIKFQANAITFLSGDNLHEKKHNNFSFTGILDAIPSRYDQISNFYSKLKNK